MNTAARQSIAKAKALIDRRFTATPTRPHAYVFPPSAQYKAAIRFDPADRLYKYPDGKLVPINSDEAILRAVKARHAETERRSEEALAAADKAVAA